MNQTYSKEVRQEALKLAEEIGTADRSTAAGNEEQHPLYLEDKISKRE